MCFFSPIRNDPKKTHHKQLSAPTQSRDNPANLFMFTCFSFPESGCDEHEARRSSSGAVMPCQGKTPLRGPAWGCHMWESNALGITNGRWTDSGRLSVADRLGESLGGSQAAPSFWKVPGLPQKFPKPPRKFFGDFPGSSLTVELNSNPGVPRKFPRLPRKLAGLPQKFPRTSPEVSPFLWEA